ncbi:MAG TPA: hypothetical protein VK704_08040 [Acidimicrobiales bacterium]|jgi:hypothetical protein|nr:hypothetical protein [Acidimicrobiales bacterium]
MTDFAGLWNATLYTPIGEMSATFDIHDDNGVITGTSSNGKETVEILDAVATGNKLTWNMKVTTPMKLTLKFDMEFDGDSMEGTSKAGILPSSRVVGTRAPTT